MKNFNYFKGMKIWLISIFSFDLLMILYLFISGRILDIDPIFPDFVTIVAGIFVGLSIIVGFASIIYAIVKKQYEYILHGIGILFCSLVLYLAMLVIALSTIY